MTATSVVAASWWAQHSAHTFLLGAPAVAIALAATIADLRARMRTRVERDETPQRAPLPLVAKLAVVLSLGAASVHLWVCPEHFREAFIYGLFFLGAATAQLGWVALVIVRPRRWLAFGGLVGNSAVMLLWTYTRTIGDFAGPEKGQVEAIGPADLVATGCEIGVVICTVIWIRQITRAGDARGARRLRRAIARTPPATPWCPEASRPPVGR